MNVFWPFRTLAEAGGSVILMGVSIKTMTIIHLAEQMAGRNLFRRWANDHYGSPMEVEVGSCSDGFDNLEPILSPLVKETKVGRRLWRIFPAKDTLEAAGKAVRGNLWLTHYSNPGCDRCNDAVMGGPIL